MQRIHLFEFEDQPWFPHTLREAMTDFLSFMGEKVRAPYKDFAARLHQAMTACGEEQLVELCSGGGGPAWTIATLLRSQHGRAAMLMLTDLFPNLARLQHIKDRAPGSVDFWPAPVDATRVPSSLGGFRLLCNGFHHFRPEQAREILRDAVAQRRGIAIFEALERSCGGLAQLLFLAGAVFFVTPFIRPFRFSRLLLTYAIPAVPLFILWDGVVSCLRIYSPEELRELIASLSENGQPPDYEWQIGQASIPLSTARTTYLIGYPRGVAGIGVATEGKGTQEDGGPGV